MSLVAGLVFGGLSAYGAFNISNDPKNIKVSLCKCVQNYIFVDLSQENSYTHVNIWFCGFSFRWTSCFSDGNKIQEFWKVPACWPNVWAKVRVTVAQHADILLSNT